MSRYIEFSPDEFYHLYNRGTEKREIFSDSSDWFRFVLLLHLANSADSLTLGDHGRGSTSPELFQEEVPERLVDIGAYCLMPNHFHILAREKEAGGISKFMQKLLTAYTMYFNRKHDRSGALFQGKFKAVHVDSDEQLKYLFAYIHLNPIKTVDPEWRDSLVISSLLDYLRSYKYSSLPDYLDGGPRSERVIINKSVFPQYFATAGEHLEELKDWLGEVEPRRVG